MDPAASVPHATPPVDLVYTWVNGADADLHAERARYAAAEVKGDFQYRAGQARFQDHGELRYSLRSVERHLPFVRKIFIAHAGAAPSWLAPRHDDLVCVPQEEIVPSRFWPTFQSDVVEAFLHRIPGLAEHYVYANDDCFFASTHVPGDFFDDEGRAIVGRDWRIAGTHRSIGLVYRAIETNTARAVRRHLNVPAVRAAAAPPRWRSRLRLGLLGALPINAINHVAQPFRKSIWEGFHRTFHAEMEDLCRRRFRSSRGWAVNLAAHHYALANAMAQFRWIPYALLRRGASLEEAAEFVHQVKGGTAGCSRFCLNDGPGTDCFDWGAFVDRFLEDLWPQPSRWESAGAR